MSGPERGERPGRINHRNGTCERVPDELLDTHIDFWPRSWICGRVQTICLIDDRDCKTTSLAPIGGIEAIAGLLIGLVSIETALRGLHLFVRLDSSNDAKKEEIRIHLGLWLSLALELELAADILRPAIAPRWNEIVETCFHCCTSNARRAKSAGASTRNPTL